MESVRTTVSEYFELHLRGSDIFKFSGEVIPTGSIPGGLTSTLALHKWRSKMRLLKHLCIYEFMSYIVKIT